MFSLDVLADTIREMYMQGVDAADYSSDSSDFSSLGGF